MAPSKNFSQKFCNFIYVVLKYVLALGLTAIMCVPAIYHLANEDSHNVQQHPLHKSFHTHPHQSLKQKLDSATASYLYGKQPQQIEHFVDYYTHEESQKGWKVVKWEFDGDADLTDYVPVNDIKLEIEKYIDVEQQRPTIWVISMNGNRDKLWQVSQLMARYPSDRFIVIAQKKQKVSNFAFFEIPEVSIQDFQNSLVQHLGIPKNQARILIKHYGSVHKTMENIDNDCQDLQCVLGSNYHTLENLGKSQIRKMQQLCTDGTVEADSSTKNIDQMGAFFHQGKYYWRSIESALNFQLQFSYQKPCVFVESGLMFWQMPGALNFNLDLDQILERVKNSVQIQQDALTEEQKQAYEDWFEDQQHIQQQNQDNSVAQEINQNNQNEQHLHTPQQSNHRIQNNQKTKENTQQTQQRQVERKSQQANHSQTNQNTQQAKQL